MPPNYAAVLAELKARVRAVHTQAVVTVNRALIALYMDIGRRLADEAATAGWGDRVVEHVAADLQAAFPDVRGFSRSNVFYMRQVAAAWAEADTSVQQLVGQMPWGHHLVLVAKVSDPVVRTWYLMQTVANGWSRAILTAHIASNLYARQGQAVTNFARTLEGAQAALAQLGAGFAFVGIVA